MSADPVTPRLDDGLPWQALADAVLVLHVAVVVFVVGGLVAVLVGNLTGRWRWVNQPVFRGLHLLAIAVVVVQAWLGQWCPLTLLESWLRVQAGASGYSRSFIEHWLQRLLFHEAPWWVFTLAYSFFGALVLLAWWRFPPDRTRVRRPGAGSETSASNPAMASGDVRSVFVRDVD